MSTLFASTVMIYIAAVMLSGCSSAETQQAFGPRARTHTNALQQDLSQPDIGGLASGRIAMTAQLDTGRSWMAPSAVAQDLLYVSDVGTVTVYSYPKGSLEGKLRGFYIAQGMCVDKKANVYITDQGTGQVYEYAHGGRKRIKTLYSGDAVGCSIDPTSGNLAVTDLQGGRTSGNGNLAVFKNARGNPTYYSDSGFWEYYFCGYDDKGNLFIDGLSSPGTGNFVFAELPKGSNAFTNIALDQYVGFPGGVQWDGKHVAVGDQTTSVYEFSITGRRGKLVGATQLGGASYVKQFWIQGSKLIAPNAPSGSGADVLFYKYPSGGTAIKRISKGVRGPQGATVSKAAT